MSSETSESIAVWAATTFGKAEPSALVERARVELAELKESISLGDSAAIVSEAADVAILLHRLAWLHGTDLTAAVDEKMARNRARIWEPTGDGTGRHVAEPSQTSKAD